MGIKINFGRKNNVSDDILKNVVNLDEQEDLGVSSSFFKKNNN